MEEPSLLHNSSKGTKGLQELLQQDNVIKQQVHDTVNKYATLPGPHGALDEFLHPKLQTTQCPDPANTAPQQQQLVPIDAQETAESKSGSKVVARDKEEEFMEAIKLYEDNAKEKYKTGVDLNSTHTIKELWTIVDEEVQNYHDKEKKGVWGKIRLAFRKLGDGGDAVQGWLGLVPSESNYMSIVCGGLKLIIKAAARMRNVAKEILDALHAIPSILTGARRVLNVFRDQEILKDKSKALYNSILTAMGHMLEYLRRKSTRKMLKVVFKQQSFEADLLTKIEDITKARNEFNEESELCHKEVLQKLGEDSSRNTDEVAKLAEVLSVYSDEQKRSQQAIFECVEGLSKGINDMKRDLKDVPLKTARAILELLRASPTALEHVIQMNQPLDGPDNTGDTGVIRRASVVDVVKSRSRKTASPTRETLLSKLDYDRNAIRKDIAINYRLGADLSKDDQERSLHVIKSTQLAEWVQSDRSAVLIVNGHAKKVTRKSAMSFVCARLVYALNEIRCGGGGNGQGESSSSRRRAEERPDVIPLYFACGQHTSLEESWESPSGVVNSLLAQLLTHCKDINLTNLPKLGRNFDNSDIEDFIRLFKRVIAHLPAETTIFCVLDGPSFYADMDDTSEDAEILLAGLVKLASKASRKQPVFKLLLTAPNRLRVPVDSSSGRLSTLNVPSTLRNTGGFTAMKWNMGVGQKLNEMAEEG
ncbi:hypothetical protein N0V82_006733 [Gnomoniopsis sp. IMI 355080]|nr:hypothetical protein N0V82_006733 [Gnomoniopsis sp. IMI 355080]